jgi:hypothetical protein
MADLSHLQQLDAPDKEQLYREFWAGNLPGTVLVNASQRLHNPQPPTVGAEQFADDPFGQHLAAEYTRLTQRDWTRDDAVPSPMVPVGPTGTIATAFGSTYDPAYDWTHQCLKCPEAIWDLEPPRLGAGLTGWYLDGVRYMAEAVGDALPVCFAQVMQGPLSTCSMILDDQVLLEAMYTHPEAIHRLLEMVTDFIVELAQEIRRLLPRPVPTNFFDVYLPDGQGIGLSDDLAAVVSPWLYRDFVVPHLNRLSDTFGGVFLHACGDPAGVYPVWGEVRGFRGFDIGATEADVTEAFRCFSGSAVIVLHVGLNSAPHFPSRLAVVEEILRHVTPESSVYINATSHISNLPPVTPDEWDAESAQIVARVRAHSPRNA